MHWLVKMLSTVPGGHVVHCVAEPVQVAQLGSHGWQVLPTRYVPGGQVLTQLVPLSSGVAEVALQPVQPMGPLQVPQVGWHCWHAVPSE